MMFPPGGIFRDCFPEEEGNYEAVLGDAPSGVEVELRMIRERLTELSKPAWLQFVQAVCAPVWPVLVAFSNALARRIDPPPVFGGSPMDHPMDDIGD